jgi:hypothetical protein
MMCGEVRSRRKEVLKKGREAEMSRIPYSCRILWKSQQNISAFFLRGLFLVINFTKWTAARLVTRDPAN